MRDLEFLREKLDDAGFEHKGIKSAKPAHILNGAGVALTMFLAYW